MAYPSDERLPAPAGRLAMAYPRLNETPDAQPTQNTIKKQRSNAPNTHPYPEHTAPTDPRTSRPTPQPTPTSNRQSPPGPPIGPPTPIRQTTTPQLSAHSAPSTPTRAWPALSTEAARHQRNPHLFLEPEQVTTPVAILMQQIPVPLPHQPPSEYLSHHYRLCSHCIHTTGS